MIKKLYLMVFGLMATFSIALAQNQITGKVTDDKGNPVIKATVTEKGIKNSVATNENGEFKITVKSTSAKLVITSVGYEKLEVQASNASLIQLKQVKVDLEEVVVSGAYNTKQIARNVSYNAQRVSGEELNLVRSTSLNNALAGKVAGLQVRGQSALSLGRVSELRLRGPTGTGERGSTISATLANREGLAQPEGLIYVVDGTILYNPDLINLDDIEDVTVLQGPAAAAQFGSQGAYGAIVISLKKGKTGKGLNVTVLSGVQFDNVAILPQHQNTYAGGLNNPGGSIGNLIKYEYKSTDPIEWKALDGKYYHDYTGGPFPDSWGPRMIGQEYIPWYAWYGGHSRSFKTAKLTPQPDNIRDFYNTAATYNNTISFSTSDKKYQIRGSIGNVNITGLLPNTSLIKTVFNLAVTYDISDKLKFNTNINFLTQNIQGELDDRDLSNSTGQFNQAFHRDLDINILRELKDLRTPTGIWASWNHGNPTSYDPLNPKSFYAGSWWLNPFKYFDNDLQKQYSQEKRIFGDIGLTYNFTKDLSVRLTYRRQESNVIDQKKYSQQLDASLRGSPRLNFDGVARGYFGQSNINNLRENVELFVTYTKQIKDFKIYLLGVLDQYSAEYSSTSGNTNNGFLVPDLYTLNNSVNQATASSTYNREKHNSVLGKFSVGFKNYIFIDGAIRTDWYSALPPNNNAVLSESIGLSLIISDLVKIPNLNFLKFRVSLGQIPTSIGIYTYPGFEYYVNPNTWKGNFITQTPNLFVDPKIHGAVTVQKELGLEFKILNSRLGLNLTYYEREEKDFPRDLPQYAGTGFTNQLINTGLIRYKGIEAQLNARPIVSQKVNWTINATFSQQLENILVEIGGGLERIGIQGTEGNIILVHAVGKPWGELYGAGIKRLNGKPILNDDGSYVQDPERVYFGNVTPKFTGGLQNTIEVYNFIVNFNIDYQVGGKYYSHTDLYASWNGLSARTAALNDKGFSVRDPVVLGGGVHVIGVKADGTPYDKYIDARTYFQNLIIGRGGYDEFVYDLTFVKLREVSIGYNIPVGKIKFFKRINRFNISLVARNPLLIYAISNDFDPSEIKNVSGESGNFPSAKGYGIIVRINF